MSGYMPVNVEQFVAQYLRNNPGGDPAALRSAVQEALAAWRQGVRCGCGNPLWVAGSAVAGYGCFACISGTAQPDGDPEIREVCDPYCLEVDDAEEQYAQVAEIIKNHPHDYRQRLEAYGYVWQEDDHEKLFEEEEREERAAVAETDNQRGLIHFFENGGPVTATLLEAYLTERYTQTPNVPLIRRYFKQANPNLKAILLAGLSARPTDADLLDDLAYFSEFDSMLGELIRFYMDACFRETDLERFSLLAQDFHVNTCDQGFDALYELTSLFRSGSKGAVVQHLSETMDAYNASLPEAF